jgi:hypothetical protein
VENVAETRRKLENFEIRSRKTNYPSGKIIRFFSCITVIIRGGVGVVNQNDKGVSVCTFCVSVFGGGNVGQGPRGPHRSAGAARRTPEESGSSRCRTGQCEGTPLRALLITQTVRDGSAWGP